MLRSHGAGVIRTSHIGEDVTLAGWVARRRDHGGVAFIDLRDATSNVQVVISDEKVEVIVEVRTRSLVANEPALRSHEPLLALNE